MQQYSLNQTRSAALYQRALNIMPGGCSRNTVLRKPHPLYAERGEGCYVTDIDGVKRIDFSNNMASLIHGHAQPKVVDAVTKQLKKGTAFTLATEAEILFAEHLCSRNEGFEKIRFVNSGTEAVMSCIKAARAYTGRSKIAKVEGAYHGLYDFAEVSQTAKPNNWGAPEHPSSVPVSYGTPAGVLNDVIVIPFNDINTAIALLNQHASELACVLIDLMPHRVGLMSASQEFVKAIHQWTRNKQALLVYDEVITFRNHYGGAQQGYDITPDLTAMGKLIGGGFPVGALAGRAEVMDVMNPLLDKVLFPHSGTFSANPITMTAGRVAMELFDQEAVIRLNQLANYARDQITLAISLADIPACVVGEGSILRVYLKHEAPLNYRESLPSNKEARLLQELVQYLFNNGIMLIDTCCAVLSTAMTKNEIDVLADIMLEGFREIKKHL
ncbi:aspartate aminotransferase family protein [bacterium AH-315-K03]|nr:aspartate aminotransferase family protein [bacterium AH-315-K03]